jgi:4-hydroxyphenylacetate 3-monooxygenase
MVEGLVAAIEIRGERWGAYFIPNRHLVYTALALTQQLYPKIMTTLRELAGGSMIMLPSGIEDLADPAVAGYALRAQGSPVLAPLERVKFFKLVWDAVGSEFASRHIQYEMFYAGAGFVTQGHSFRTYDWDRSTALVDRLLDGYNLTEEINGR